MYKLIRNVLIAGAFALGTVFIAHGAYAVTTAGYPSRPTFATVAANTGTIAANSPALSLSQTWNNAGVSFTGALFNFTDSTSAAASNLFDVQAAGVSKFSIGKTGIVSMPAGSLIIGGDTRMTRKAAATLQLGAIDAAAPVAQTLGVQSVVAGTTDTAGQDFTIKGSAGTGTGAGGNILLQTSPAATTGSTQNAQVTRFAISPAGQLTGGPSLEPVRQIVSAYKTTDTVRTLNATPSADPELSVNLALGGIYHVRIDVFYTVGASGATPGLNIGTTFSGASVLLKPCTLIHTQGTAFAATNSLSSALGSNYGLAPTGTSGSVTWDCVINVGTAGALAISWSQVASSATATTVQQGSLIMATRVN